MIKNIKRLQNIYIFFYGLLVIFLSTLFNDTLYLIILTYIYSLTILFIYSKKTLSDPRVLLFGFFTLYSTFYPIMIQVTNFSFIPINYNFLETSIKYQLFALFVFITVLNVIIKKDSENLIMPNFLSKNKILLMLSEKLILSITIPIILIAMIFIMKSGAASKRELLETGGIINQLAMFSFLIITSIAILRAIRLKKHIITDIYLQTFFILTLFFMLLTGERDIFFRIVFIALLIYFDKKRNSNFFIVLSILIGVSIIVPISQGFKAVLLSGEINLGDIGLELILSNEFISASRNFYSLLLFGVDHSVSYFFNDILRALIPSFLLVDSDITSTVSWYHNVYRVKNHFSGTSGWGFGLVAQGYLIGGKLGIFFIISLYASIIGILYNIRYKSIYWYTFYLLSFVTAIYVIRADVANLLSQVFKIGGSSVLILYFSHKILENRKGNTK